MRRIPGKKHKIGKYEINKISLLCFDDKKFVLDDAIYKLAYFHKDLKNRFLQLIIEILKDDHKMKIFSQMKISARR